MYRITVELIVDVASEAEACDAANEILREQQRDFTEGSCLLDYCVLAPENCDWLGDPANYQEGDAFRLADS
jgi:hypothetical protein